MHDGNVACDTGIGDSKLNKRYDRQTEQNNMNQKFQSDLFLDEISKRSLQLQDV
jgi:hypothetical protein